MLEQEAMPPRIDVLDGNSDPAMLEMVTPIVENLVRQEIEGDVDREKIIQYANATRNDLYYHGKQYLYPVRQNDETVGWSAVSGNLAANSPVPEVGRTYDYTLNYIRGDGDKAIAILSQKIPACKAVPNRQDDDQKARLSQKADIVAQALLPHWNMEEQMRRIALSLWKNGTTFIYTPWVSSSKKYGTTTLPIIKFDQSEPGVPEYHCLNCGDATPAPEVDPMQPTCPTCGAPLDQSDLRESEPLNVPVQDGEQTYPNGSVEFHIGTIFEVTTPFYSRGINDLPWLWFEREIHKAAAIEAYPWMRSKLRDDAMASAASSTSATGQVARDRASSPSKTLVRGRKNRVLESYFWITPAMYEMIPVEQDEKARQVADVLRSNFPDGAKLTFANRHLARIEHESIQEVWTIIKPRASEYIYADPLCEDYLGPQDVINDMFNMFVESNERSIPITLYDPSVIDPAAIAKNRATPAEFIPAKANIGGSLKDAMYSPPVAKVEPQAFQLAQDARDAGRQIVGVLPAMFGGDEGREQTAKEATMKRNQALMQFNTAWNYVRSGIATALENAVMQSAKYGSDRLAVRRGAGMPVEIVEIEGMVELIEGGWHMEAAEGMPMTWSDRRDLVWSLLEKSQDPIALLGGMSPSNVQEWQEAIGMPEWKVPFYDAIGKVRDTIRRLSQEAPTIAPQFDLSMPPQQPQPSIPPDEFEDDHMFVANAVKDWAQTQAARSLREKFPPGYDNVIAWGRAHFMMAQAAMMPPPGPNGGPPPPDGPPGMPPALNGPDVGQMAGGVMPPEAPAPMPPDLASGAPEPQISR